MAVPRGNQVREPPGVLPSSLPSRFVHAPLRPCGGLSGGLFSPACPVVLWARVLPVVAPLLSPRPLRPLVLAPPPRTAPLGLSRWGWERVRGECGDACEGPKPPRRVQPDPPPGPAGPTPGHLCGFSLGPSRGAAAMEGLIETRGWVFAVGR